MKFFTSIFALASFASVAAAGTLRASPVTPDEGASNVEPSNSARELTSTDWKGPLFYLQSYGAGDGYYLGYSPNDWYAWIKPTQSPDKFAYTKDHHLEKYNDNGGKTGKCYEMDDSYKTSLKNCDYNQEKQKWLLSKAPEYHGYYTITNSYYSYALEYYPTDYTYYMRGQDWKNVNYYGDNAYKNLLFYKDTAYTKYPNKACRTNSSGGTGTAGGKDYIKYDNKERHECKKICDKDYKCKGWEYSSGGRCEIWFNEPKYWANVNGFECYVKEHY